MPSKGMLQKINHESHDKYPYVHVGTLVSMCNTEYWGEAVVEYGKYIKLRKEAKMIIVVDKWLLYSLNITPKQSKPWSN